MINMDLKSIVTQLCNDSGVSGCEAPAAETAKKMLADFAQVTTDRNGNVIARLNNSSSDKTIILDAHLDRIGLMVTEINPDGFVKVDKCGGIDVRTLLDTELVLQGNSDIVGVVCCMPPHLSDGNEDKAVSIDKIWVDFGMTSDEVKKHISIGDLLTFKSQPTSLLNNRICSAALDNRCGVASLIRCAQLLKDEKQLPYNVVILLSSQEETFGTGAKTGAFSLDADEAIVVDVSFASQPDVSGIYGGITLGGGAMICVSPILNKEMSNKLIKLSQENSIPYQLEPISGTTGTNADHITVTKSGVKTSVISIPQKNMHTPSEIISLDDVENTARLIAEYIRCGGAFNA